MVALRHGAVGKEHRPFQSALGLRFPPFAHRASGSTGGPAPWTKRGKRAGLEQRSERGSTGLLATGAGDSVPGVAGSVFHGLSTGAIPRNSKRRWAGGGKRGAGSSGSSTRAGRTQVRPIPPQSRTSPVSNSAGLPAVATTREVAGRNIAPFNRRRSCVSHPSTTAPPVCLGTGAVDEAWKTRGAGAAVGTRQHRRARDRSGRLGAGRGRERFPRAVHGRDPQNQ